MADEVETEDNGNNGVEALETRDWLDSLDDVIYLRGADRAETILRDLQQHAQKSGVRLPVTSVTPYINTIPPQQAARLSRATAKLERRIKSLIRWNAMAMVVRANKTDSGIGGHISHLRLGRDVVRSRRSTISSAAGRTIIDGDLVYFRATRRPAFTPARFSKAA